MGANYSGEIPKTMKRLVFVNGNDDVKKAELKVEELAVPTPKSGQVLIKVIAAPINPSDYGEWKLDNSGKPPRAIGKEGSGVVVSSGGGIVANRMVGKKVGFVNLPRGQGAYSEFVCVPAMTAAFPLPDQVPVEDACSFFVNPYTAYGLLETAIEKKSSGLVHTAAASQLGQMLVKLCLQRRVPLINVVRRQEQKDILTAIGAEHIIVNDHDGWKQELKELMTKLRITVVADAIGGDMAGELIGILPNNGYYYNYGRLSGKDVGGINGLDIIYRAVKIEGWLLPRWINGGTGSQITTLVRIRAASNSVLPALKDGWSASQYQDCSLENAFEEFQKMWVTGFTNRKLRIRMPEFNKEQEEKKL